MKNFLTILLICFGITTFTKGQNLITKVPNKASLVIKYAGENFSKQLPVEKLDNYSFIKKDFFKALGMDTLTSINNTGINLAEDNYQYAAKEDTCINFVTLIHLKNAAQFATFIKTSYGAKSKTENKNDFDFLTVSNNTYVGWNNSVAIIVNTTYQNKIDYYTNKYKTDTIKVTTEKTEGTLIQVDTTIPITTPKVKPYVDKHGYKVPQKGKDKTAYKKKKEVVKKKKPKVQYDDEIEAQDDAIADSIENVKRDLWDQQQDMIAKGKQRTMAETIMNRAFAGSYSSIEKENSYTKIIESTANISVWIDNDDLTNLYNSSFSYSSNRYSSVLNSVKQLNSLDTTAGFKSAVNIYFEKDKLRLQQKTFSTDEALTTLSKNMMESKQNPLFANFINADNIGYMSISVNTEATVNYYYTLLKKYIANTAYVGEYSDVANVYIDMLQIMIDEKGIAELINGNYLFVMHNMQSKTVTYTDYTYDKDYTPKPITKTKKEPSPNFTFVMQTKKDDFMERLAKLPLKYAKKNHYTYLDRGGYYELVLDSSALPVSNMYFMVKNGQVITTTNKEVIVNALTNTGFSLDVEAKKNILNNNYALKLDSKRLFEILAEQTSTKANKKVCEYMQNNIGDITSDSNYKDGMIQGSTIINIKGNHSNSLEFFFNIAENIKTIYENEQAEDLKRAD